VVPTKTCTFCPPGILERICLIIRVFVTVGIGLG